MAKARVIMVSLNAYCIIYFMLYLIQIRLQMFSAFNPRAIKNANVVCVCSNRHLPVSGKPK